MSLPNSARAIRPIQSYSIHVDAIEALDRASKATGESKSSIVERVLLDALRQWVRK